MFCTECGTTINANSKFCSSCGAQQVATDDYTTNKISIHSTAVNQEAIEKKPLSATAVYLITPFLVVLILYVLDHGINFGISSTINNNVGSSTNLTQQDLMSHALKEIYESNYSIGSPGGACDEVKDARLDNIRFGTISRTSTSDHSASPLPAIVARHDFICVNSIYAKEERDPDQWVIFAIDKKYNLSRCVRTGTKQIIDQLIMDCGFVDSK